MTALSPNKEVIRVVAAVIGHNGKYLITQRRPNAVLPLKWEFPGGKVEAGESDVDALRREIRHRLDVEVETGELISYVTHPYESCTVELYLYACTLTGGEPKARAVQTFEWVSSREFDSYPFTPADESSMRKLLGLGDAS